MDSSSSQLPWAVTVIPTAYFRMFPLSYVSLHITVSSLSPLKSESHNFVVPQLWITGNIIGINVHQSVVINMQYQYSAAASTKLKWHDKIKSEWTLECFLSSLWKTKVKLSRSQCPRGLRCRSTVARLPRLWVRIPTWAWMFVVSVVCCQVEVSATR